MDASSALHGGVVVKADDKYADGLIVEIRRPRRAVQHDLLTVADRPVVLPLRKRRHSADGLPAVLVQHRGNQQQFQRHVALHIDLPGRGSAVQDRADRPHPRGGDLQPAAAPLDCPGHRFAALDGGDRRPLRRRYGNAVPRQTAQQDRITLNDAHTVASVPAQRPFFLPACLHFLFWFICLPPSCPSARTGQSSCAAPPDAPCFPGLPPRGYGV